MRTFEISVDIAASTPVVWAIMKDVERWREWTPTITSIRFLRGGRLEPGAKVLIRQPKLLPAIWRVVEIDEGASFTWENVNPGVRVTGRHSVERISTGTRVRLALEFSGIFGGFVARMMQRLNESYLQTEANGLKRQSEAFNARSAESA